MHLELDVSPAICDVIAICRIQPNLFIQFSRWNFMFGFPLSKLYTNSLISTYVRFLLLSLKLVEFGTV